MRRCRRRQPGRWPSRARQRLAMLLEAVPTATRVGFLCSEPFWDGAQGATVREAARQTAVINSIRAHLAEFGIVAPVGRKGVTELLRVVADPNDKRVPEVARACLAALGTQLLALKEQILEFDRMIGR
jgi:hypothetical protein